jgi:hypothetical protein
MDSSSRLPQKILEKNHFNWQVSVVNPGEFSPLEGALWKKLWMTWGEPVIYQPQSVDELQNVATRSRGNHRGTVETFQHFTGNRRVERVEA